MEMKLCPTCSQPCEYKNGIMCTWYVCAKKDPNRGKDMASMFSSIFGIKPGDKGYNAFTDIFNQKSSYNQDNTYKPNT